MATYSASWKHLEDQLGARPVLGGTTDELRAAFGGLVSHLSTQCPDDLPVVPTENGSVDRVKYRVYTPKQVASADAPVSVHIHGGGLVLGDLDSEDQLCRQLADRTGLVLVSVDYRLAPEHKAPAQVDDCLRVVEWAVQKTPKVLLIGISAGGGLALSVARRIVRGKSATVSSGHLVVVVALAPVALHPDHVPLAVLRASGTTSTSYTDFATGAAIVNRATMDTFFGAAAAAPTARTPFPASTRTRTRRPT